MKMVLEVERNLCTGCRLCEAACSLKKSNRFSPFKSAIRIFRDTYEGIDMPLVCRQCNDPPCEKVCPIEEPKPIFRDKQTGVVIISQDNRCIGCYECVGACPFGAIFVDPENNKLIKCDLCGGEPECVRWCPTVAIRFVGVGMLGTRKGKVPGKK